MRVAIAGYGIEGEQSAKYWLDRGDEVTILDEKSSLDRDIPSAAKVVLGDEAFDDLGSYDLVVRTASLAPRKLASAQKVWSATNEFFAQCPVPIVGVTGTKGKGTTSSLIASILKSAGKKVHLVGNIGTPALEVLSDIDSDDIVVYEMSSFQLWDLEKSPDIGVVLMIEPDHLDVHASFEEYIDAKSHIARHQTTDDTLVYHPTNQYARQIATSGEGKKIRYGVSDDGGAYVSENTFFVQDHAICGVDTLHIVGAHNLDNACAAITAARAVLPEVTDGQITDGLRSFTGLPHRLKFVAEVEGVKYYDDSIATTPGSAIAAMKSFDGSKVIILGGSDKGADYSEVVEAARQTGSQVLAIGQTGSVIYDLCREVGAVVEREEGMMPDVVSHASSMAQGNGVVILSPASASFDQYKSYADRGDQFVATVQLLASNS